MALGDGIRRNAAKITQLERDRLRDAFVKLDTTKFYPDGTSYWDKQNQIHQATHVHGGPSFLTWHRELCNRLEALLREVDPLLSLHYWDWMTDPRSSPNGVGGITNLFTPQFMGSAAGDAGPPFEAFESTEGAAHPVIWRQVDPGAPTVASDTTIITSGDSLADQAQYRAMRLAVEGAHNGIHGYIGGTIQNGHFAFHDPFVFLLHSNVDRLFARWQEASGRGWRLDPNLVYGTEGAHPLILENLEPWAGASGLRPWAPPDNQQEVKNSKDPSIVTPPLYDLPNTPAVVSWGADRLDIFVVNYDRALYHKWWDGNSWRPMMAGWEYQGGIVDVPTAVSWSPNRLDVFAVGTDLALYHKWWDGNSWGPSVTSWESLGGTIVGSPTAVSWAPDRLDVFAVGTDRALYHKWWDGNSWGPSVTSWESLGGTIVGSPTAVSWAPDRLDVFAVGTDRALYHKWWDGNSWGPSVTSWESLGGTIVGSPTAVSWAPDRLDVFAVGTDRALYHKWWDGNSWGPSVTGWESLGGTIVGSPTAVSWAPDRLDVFAVGTDRALYHKWWDGNSWGPSVTGWESLGGTIVGSPTAVSWAPDRLDVFAVGTDRALYHKWWDGNSWGPSVTGWESLGGTID